MQCCEMAGTIVESSSEVDQNQAASGVVFGFLDKNNAMFIEKGDQGSQKRHRTNIGNLCIINWNEFA